jgi:hypothetical protein
MEELANDAKILADILEQQFPVSAGQGEFQGWLSPPLDVLDCVLSLNRQYETFCLPRVTAFAAARPEVKTLADLCALIESYPTPLDFSITELNYRDERRAVTLLGVIRFLITIQGRYEGVTESERLAQWALAAKPEDTWDVGVAGFGLAGFQYMRMLFGAQTAKPDIHIRRFVSEALGRPVGDEEALRLLELAATSIGRSAAGLDYAVWLQRSTRTT